MLNLNAVILDIDGTLILSNEAHALAFAEAAAAVGIPADLEKIRKLIGKGGDKLIPEAFGIDADSPQGKQLAEIKTRIFRALHLPFVQAAPGTRPLLTRLRQDRIRLVVATSAGREEAMLLLERARVKDLLDQIATADDADASKPDPDILEAALRKIDEEPHAAIMLGDTPYDVQAAQRAGIPILAVRCGGWSDDDLKGAIGIYDNPSDVLAHYEEIFPRLHPT